MLRIELCPGGFAVRRSWMIGLAAGALLVLVALFGPGALTASGAEPEFCGTCHVMEKNVASFQHTTSTHGTEISCSDCHLPSGPLAKLTAKYSTGVRHVWTTIIGKTPEELKLSAADRKLLVDNCVYCHAGESHTQQNGVTSCLNCHSTDPHGERGL